MAQKLHVTVHGKTIELVKNPGLADGQNVEIQITAIRSTSRPGDGIRRSSGAWKDRPELDATLDQIYQERKIERRPQ